MSIDSLLCEFKPSLAARLTLNSAEQAAFGGHVLQTKVSLSGANTGPCTSKQSTEHGYHCDKQNKDEGQHGHQEGNPLLEAIANAKKTANDALSKSASATGGTCDASALGKEVKLLREESRLLRKDVDELKALLANLSVTNVKAAAAAHTQPADKEKKEEDDDFELFGSSDEEEDAEKTRVTEQRLAEYAAKKANKPTIVAKSSVILDVKPWDDETDLAEMERYVRSIEKDGLIWGGSKLVPLAYGIKKLQIICVIEDLKVSVDDLIENITEGFPDFVQSVDISAFNKI